MIKSEKQEMIERIKERFQASSSAICIEFRGVNVDTVTQFRRELQEVSGEYQVVKNTLAKRAINDTSFQELSQYLVGPTGVVFCPQEAAESAKVVTKYVNETKGAFQIKGGVVEGTLFDADGIKQVAKLPSRQELLSQLVTSLQSPMSGLVSTLGGVTREFVYTLQAIADKKESEG